MVDKQKYKTLLIASWVVLFVCFIIKLFGGNWFNIICENKTFIDLCYVLDYTKAKYIVSTIVYTTSSYLIYLCLSKQKLFNDLWILALLIPASWCKENIAIVGWIIDILVWIVIPVIKVKIKNSWWVAMGIVLILVFQLVSLFTKNININLTNESSLVALIMQIDYYIMIILYYLYIQLYKRKEKN